MREEIQLGENKIILVGTGHVFQESVDLVRNTILEVHPHCVALELDRERLQALQGNVRKPGLSILRMGIRFTILGSILSYFQDKVGEQTGVSPGAEMMEAVRAAQDVNAKVEFIDAPVLITLNRLISEMSFFETVRLIFYMLTPSKIELDKVDEPMVTDLTEELHRLSPSAYRVLIEERDRVMAHNLLQLSGVTVAVVGAGHVKGIKHFLMETYKRGEEEKSHEVHSERN